MVQEFDALVAKYANADWKDEYLSLLQVDSAQKSQWPRAGGFRFAQDDPAAADAGSAGGAPPPGGDAGSAGGGGGGPPSAGGPGGSSGSSGGGSEASLVGACEVCVFVIENKEQHQPYLCRGLKDPNYQKACVETMESLMWWLTNQVYWLNYGCQREMNGAVEWVRPCPAHAVCSWIEQLYTRTPFCPADPYYKKPQ